MKFGAALAETSALHRILHIGCGREHLPLWLKGEETRLDIDPSVSPDIVASMTALGEVGTYDVLYCAHALEHLYPHEVATALSEFRRALVPGGAVIVFVPDLEDARATDDVLYVSPAGPITGVDLLYGFRPKLAEMPHMAHHCGFTSATLKAALEGAGFGDVITKRLGHFNLFAVGKSP